MPEHVGAIDDCASLLVCCSLIVRVKTRVRCQEVRIHDVHQDCMSRIVLRLSEASSQAQQDKARSPPRPDISHEPV
eukprot:7513265-Alexandrium_andersonii.AAC.1